MCKIKASIIYFLRTFYGNSKSPNTLHANNSRDFKGLWQI